MHDASCYHLSGNPSPPVKIYIFAQDTSRYPNGCNDGRGAMNALVFVALAIVRRCNGGGDTSHNNTVWMYSSRRNGTDDPRVLGGISVALNSLK